MTSEHEKKKTRYSFVSSCLYAVFFIIYVFEAIHNTDHPGNFARLRQFCVLPQFCLLAAWHLPGIFRYLLSINFSCTICLLGVYLTRTNEQEIFRAGCKSPLAVQSASRASDRTGETPVPTVTVWMEEDGLSFFVCRMPGSMMIRFFIFHFPHTPLFAERPKKQESVYGSCIARSPAGIHTE